VLLKTVLVTGGAGYVGSVLLRALLADGFRLVCVDKLSFGGESIIDILHHQNFVFHNCDICDFQALDVILKAEQYHAVIHLAAIVGDPACTREPETATRTNWSASKHLIDRCISLGVERFMFASTCSNYGKMADSKTYVTEKSDLAPVSLYAELKVRFENYVLEELPRSSDFSPTLLRFSTVYGASPRMRFDLTVNEFTKELALGRELVVFGEHFWRPYCHVRDFSNAFRTVLNSPQEKVAYNVFNVGDTAENYTKKMLVEEIQRQIPAARVKYVNKNEDPRDYRVSSDKIKEELGFQISMRVPDGVAELRRFIEDGIIRTPDDQRYYNIPHS
jgi:nucleoside-diphosphate-sugar epimerase